MKASCVLLRWYKSFNVNYLGYPDRRHQVKGRPWTELSIPDGVEGTESLRFIEIPIESDVTTIVGANESGKSHLLSAIAKVILGHGIPDENDDTTSFDRTDLCHYASIRNKNADAWPNIGMEFTHVTTEEWKELSAAVGEELLGGESGDAENSSFTLICAPDSDRNKGSDKAKTNSVAFIYTPSRAGGLGLPETALKKVRAILPKVQFIKSDIAMPDELPIDNLLASLGASASNGKQFFSFEKAQEAARFLSSLSVPNAETAPKDFLEQIRSAKAEAQHTKPMNGHQRTTTLEGQLFRDVLEIDLAAIEFLARLPETNRSYADSLVGTWNDEIAKVLNLSRYWQQDDLFSLRINFKRGMLFFELTDKTGAIYTFRERSSGLRYFLSYYIQAKALEHVIKSGNAIILMDEPDSYLSIIGQRNLLSVFESLVGFATAEGHVQLIYTTHSPFLINRNFPRRIRLVRKGDSEEGTQYVDESRLRRYEPVRSALGIDCAQTLFMGSTNVLLEGPTDQYLLGELIRLFSRPDNIQDLLDLNTVTLVSAESAPHVRKVLQASQWADEPVPATVVLFDDDEQGRQQKAKVTGKFNSAKDKGEDKENYNKLIDEDFVLLISDCLGEIVAADQKSVTSEDIVPIALWLEAITSYIREWMPGVTDKDGTKIAEELQKESAEKGLLQATKSAFEKVVGSDKANVDKMGILECAIKTLADAQRAENPAAWVEETRTRTVKLCQKLSERIDRSRTQQRRLTGKQTLKRLSRDFLNQYPRAAGLFDIELFLNRISREAEILGADGVHLTTFAAEILSDIKSLRAENKNTIGEDAWPKWRKRFEAIRENPLKPMTIEEPSEAGKKAEDAEPAVAAKA
jgi:predicted ATPase